MSFGAPPQFHLEGFRTPTGLGMVFLGVFEPLKKNQLEDLEASQLREVVGKF